LVEVVRKGHHNLLPVAVSQWLLFGDNPETGDLDRSEPLAYTYADFRLAVFLRDLTIRRDLSNDQAVPRSVAIGSNQSI
jgi:hypothetical protein